ncbi:hypothetical protein ES703_33894 [subsurface metagenome]
MNINTAIFKPTMYPTESSAGLRFDPKYAMLPPIAFAPSTASGQSPSAPAPTLNSPLAIAALAIHKTPLPPSWPVSRTSAVAIPSGNLSLPSTISDRRSGIVNSTPNTPPNPAIIATHLKLKLSHVPIITSAGRVNITPAASDSPADAAV